MRNGLRTTAAHVPAITHPILWESQLSPFESQKLLWSITIWLSDGQRVLFVSTMLRIWESGSVVPVTSEAGIKV